MWEYEGICEKYVENMKRISRKISSFPLGSRTAENSELSPTIWTPGLGKIPSLLLGSGTGLSYEAPNEARSEVMA